MIPEELYFTFDNAQEPEQINDSIDRIVTDEEIDSSLGINVKSKKPRKSITKQAEELVDRYLTERSDEAWSALQEFFWFGIRQFAYKYTKNMDDAYDMAIETFISAHKNIDTYNKDKAKFSTWLWTICKNNCIYFLKNKSRLPIVSSDISDLYDSTLIGSAYIQKAPEYKVQQNDVKQLNLGDVTEEMYAISVEEIGRMKGLSKKILEMRLLQNMKIWEIAEELNMNPSTVKNYLYTSKENLKKIICKKHKALYDIYVDMQYDNEHDKAAYGF